MALPGGNPKYDIPAVMAAICGQVAQSRSLGKILQAAGMPTYATVMAWMKEYPDLAEMYAHAKEAQADYCADELLELADNPDIPSDQKKLMLDTRKWIAAKLKPRVYGDRLDISGKIDHEHSVKALFDSIIPQPSLLCEDAVLIEDNSQPLD
jgi:hypothetical protein